MLMTYFEFIDLSYCSLITKHEELESIVSVWYSSAAPWDGPMREPKLLSSSCLLIHEMNNLRISIHDMNNAYSSSRNPPPLPRAGDLFLLLM